ncbi:peptidase M14, partial [Escherichia coli]|nr:peptidase M14 [Escherichia coli]
MTTWVEVVDTAVKIGFGGIITLTGTFIISKMNHKHEFDKDKSRRYYDSLESVST